MNAKIMHPCKNMHALDGGCTTGYIGILRWDGEVVSLEKHPVFLDFYRLASGRVSRYPAVKMLA